MQHHLTKLGEEVSLWPNLSLHPHRFGGLNSALVMQKLGTSTLVGSLTCHSRDQSEMGS